ncbi:MAG: CD225/dispanin family protein [Bacteroidaceae bacterium]|nr:CD225/dispanin family protein [Bacteroidaceae bacterium]
MSEQKYCPDTNMVWAILCTVLCCLPLGIVSIIKATSVEKLWYQGREEEARKASEDAKKYAMWGAIASLIVWVIYIAFYASLLGGMLGSM